MDIPAANEMPRNTGQNISSELQVQLTNFMQKTNNLAETISALLSDSNDQMMAFLEDLDQKIEMSEDDRNACMTQRAGLNENVQKLVRGEQKDGK